MVYGLWSCPDQDLGLQQIHPANPLDILSAVLPPILLLPLDPYPFINRGTPYRLTFSGPGLRRRCGCEPDACRSIRIKILDLLVLAKQSIAMSPHIRRPARCSNLLVSCHQPARRSSQNPAICSCRSAAADRGRAKVESLGLLVLQ